MKHHGVSGKGAAVTTGKAATQGEEANPGIGSDANHAYGSYITCSYVPLPGAQMHIRVHLMTHIVPRLRSRPPLGELND